MNTTNSASSQHILRICYSFTNSPIKILLLALILALCFQGTRGLFDEDETRYAECAREMLVTGQFLVPQRDFRPHITKPPLTYWTIAASMKIFGINEWAARLPNALAFALTTFLLTLIGTGLWNWQTGRFTGLIYMSSLVPLAASNIITTDTLLVMCETAAIYAFMSLFKAGTRNQARLWSYVMGMFWGMAFLTKGPAILPVVAATLVFWWFHRDRFKIFPFGPGMLCFFLITGGFWYGLLIWNDFSLLHFFLTEQVTGRLVGNVHHRNSGLLASLYIYLPMILLGTLPWLAVLLKRTGFSIFKCGILKDEGLFLACVWFLLPLGVFSFASSKLPLYILPIFPAFSLLTARHLTKTPQESWAPSFKWFLPWLCLLIALKAFMAFLPFPQDARRLAQHLNSFSQPNTQIWSLTDTFIDGIPFYTGKDILYLQWRTANKIAEASLEEQLKPNGLQNINILLLVPIGVKKEMIDFLLTHGIQVSDRGNYKKLSLLQLFTN